MDLIVHHSIVRSGTRSIPQGFGSNRFSFIRDIAELVVERDNQLIQRLKSLIREKVPF